MTVVSSLHLLWLRNFELRTKKVISCDLVNSLSINVPFKSSSGSFSIEILSHEP